MAYYDLGTYSRTVSTTSRRLRNGVTVDWLGPTGTIIKKRLSVFKRR